MIDRSTAKDEIQRGSTALGIEFGSTRIKAVLIGSDYRFLLPAAALLGAAGVGAAGEALVVLPGAVALEAVALEETAGAAGPAAPGLPGKQAASPRDREAAERVARSMR